MPRRSVVLMIAAMGVACTEPAPRKRFIGTTGAETSISGAALLVLRNTADGWRIVQFQAAHPASTDSSYGALLRRFEGTRP